LNLGYNLAIHTPVAIATDDLLLAPYCDTSDAHERLIPEKILESGKQDIHAKHDQERGGSNGRYPKTGNTEDKVGQSSSQRSSARLTHKFKNGFDFGNHGLISLWSHVKHAAECSALTIVSGRKIDTD